MLQNLNKYRIILASRSPRRQFLINELGLTFEVRTKETDEDFRRRQFLINELGLTFEVRTR
jgi:predicted house-cleaning NTP pyrophosphatase (Maf/HAM1 superfamily)